MKKPILAICLLFIAHCLFAQGSLFFNPDVPDVYKGTVDFSVDFLGEGARYDLFVEVSFDDGASWFDIPAADITGTLNNVAPASGIALRWNAMASFPFQVTNNAVLRVTARHVCGTDFTFTYQGTPVTYGTIARGGLCWMDRNLGASQMATASNDKDAYGDLFQWGRLDDGHQVVNWTSSTTGDVTPTTTTLSAGDSPGHGEFILPPNPPYDWRITQNNDLWHGAEGTNNPCPSGWRIPTGAEWNAERLSWSSNNNTGAYASTLKLPAAGLRNYDPNGIWFTGTYGTYWSSTVDAPKSQLMYFNNLNAGMVHETRAHSYSVRCVRD